MADKNKAKSVKAERRRKRVRGKIRGTTQRPRLTVAKSLRNILVQIVDDENGKTLIGLSSNSKLMQGVVLKKDTKTQMAHKVGLKVAELGKEKGIESVVFDRNRFLFHGRVKAVAAGASEGGLKI